MAIKRIIPITKEMVTQNPKIVMMPNYCSLISWLHFPILFNLELGSNAHSEDSHGNAVSSIPTWISEVIYHSALEGAV